MLKAYLTVIHASFILTDTCRYHTQLSTVASDIDMISVIFIRGKSLKLHAPMSIHTTGISSPLNRNTDCPQSLPHQVPSKWNHFKFWQPPHSWPVYIFSLFISATMSLFPSDLASFLCSASLSGVYRIFHSHVQLAVPTYKLEEMLRLHSYGFLFFWTCFQKSLWVCSDLIRKKSNLLWLSLVSLAVFGSIWLDLKIWKNAEKS